METPEVLVLIDNVEGGALIHVVGNLGLLVRLIPPPPFNVETS